MAPEREIVKDPDDARQAQHVGLKNVLIWGLVLVVVAFGVVFFVMK